MPIQIEDYTDKTGFISSSAYFVITNIEILVEEYINIAVKTFSSKDIYDANPHNSLGKAMHWGVVFSEDWYDTILEGNSLEEAENYLLEQTRFEDGVRVE